MWCYSCSTTVDHWDTLTTRLTHFTLLINLWYIHHRAQKSECANYITVSALMMCNDDITVCLSDWACFNSNKRESSTLGISWHLFFLPLLHLLLLKTCWLIILDFIMLTCLPSLWKVGKVCDVLMTLTNWRTEHNCKHGQHIMVGTGLLLTSVSATLHICTVCCPPSKPKVHFHSLNCAYIHERLLLVLSGGTFFPTYVTQTVNMYSLYVQFIA